MFTHQKKDFYSVNAEIALAPINDQQILQKMMQGEHNASQNAMIKLQEQSMAASQQDGMVDSESLAMNQVQQENQIQESQQKIIAIAENLHYPISTRYDDIYHPRTDKRVIQGNQYTYQGNLYNKGATQGNSVEECIQKIIKNQEENRAPIEFTNVLSRAKVIEMKGIKPKEKTRSFTGLYQDSQCLSLYHERQKFGLRSGEQDEDYMAKTVQKATFAAPVKKSNEEDGQQM